MATGILATACRSLDLVPLSWLSLAIALVAFLALVGVTAMRFLHHHSAVVADLDDPGRAFGFFTFVAGSSVLSVALMQAGLELPAIVLGFIGVAGWLLLTYALPLRLMLARTQPPLESVSGSWLLWVVAMQSIAAVFAMASAPSDPRPASSLRVIALMTWGVGVLLYLVLIEFIMMRLFFFKLSPEQVTPAYWINMGAAAISVLSGALLLNVGSQDVLLNKLRPFIAGLSVVLWAWASWWIPTLALMWLWRHVLRGVRLVYEPSVWSLVFPLGMYTAASFELGRAVDQPWLLTLSRLVLPVAIGAWLWAFAAMFWSWRRRPVD
jgi:tellurite resistance protein TehA-like permease